jgi:hypothetical protein
LPEFPIDVSSCSAWKIEQPFSAARHTKSAIPVSGILRPQQSERRMFALGTLAEGESLPANSLCVLGRVAANKRVVIQSLADDADLEEVYDTERHLTVRAGAADARAHRLVAASTIRGTGFQSSYEARAVTARYVLALVACRMFWQPI